MERGVALLQLLRLKPHPLDDAVLHRALLLRGRRRRRLFARRHRLLARRHRLLARRRRLVARRLASARASAAAASDASSLAMSASSMETSSTATAEGGADDRPPAPPPATNAGVAGVCGGSC